MSEQEALQKQNPSAKTSDYNARTLPRILTVTDQYGDPVQNPGFTKSNQLYFEGKAPRSELVELLDKGIPVYHPVYVTEHGDFNFYLTDQRSGDHEYSVKDSNGYESAPWVITLDITDAVSIDWITGPDGQMIEDNGSTLFSELDFVGQGEAGQKIELLDNGVVVQTFAVNEMKRWFGNVKELSTGSHEFMARGQKGQESAVWRVLIKKPAPLSIRFVLGQENYQLIENHGATTDQVVTIVGTANPNEKGWVVTSANAAEPFAANESGVYFTTFRNLAAGRHSFSLRSDLGRVSAPWVVIVIYSKLP